MWVGKRKVYTKHGEFYGAPRGGGRWKHGERSGKHGGEVEARRRVGSTGVSRSTEKGVENTEFLTEEDGKMHSFILYFYASMRRGRLMIIFLSC